MKIKLATSTFKSSVSLSTVNRRSCWPSWQTLPIFPSTSWACAWPAPLWTNLVWLWAARMADGIGKSPWHSYRSTIPGATFQPDSFCPFLDQFPVQLLIVHPRRRAQLELDLMENFKKYQKILFTSAHQVPTCCAHVLTFNPPQSAVFLLPSAAMASPGITCSAFTELSHCKGKAQIKLNL